MHGVPELCFVNCINAQLDDAFRTPNIRKICASSIVKKFVVNILFSHSLKFGGLDFHVSAMEISRFAVMA